MISDQDADQTLIRGFKRRQSMKNTWESGLNFYTFQSTICCHLKNKENHISIATSILSKQRKTHFSEYYYRGQKKGSFIPVFNANSGGLTRLNLHSLPQEWSFMERKLFCMLGSMQYYSV